MRVPGFLIHAVCFDIGDDHPYLVAGLSFENDPGLSANKAVASVATHQPVRCDGLAFTVAKQHRAYALVRLLEARERGTELYCASQLR